MTASDQIPQRSFFSWLQCCIGGFSSLPASEALGQHSFGTQSCQFTSYQTVFQRHWGILVLGSQSFCFSIQLDGMMHFPAFHVVNQLFWYQFSPPSLDWQIMWHVSFSYFTTHLFDFISVLNLWKICISCNWCTFAYMHDFLSRDNRHLFLCHVKIWLSILSTPISEKDSEFLIFLTAFKVLLFPFTKCSP